MAQCPSPKYALVSTFRPIKVLRVDFQKKDLHKNKVFVVRAEAPHFSEALGFSLPSLLVNPALAKRHVRNTYDQLVDEVELGQTNPNHGVIRYTNGHESTVSIRDLAPVGNETGLNEPKDSG